MNLENSQDPLSHANIWVLSDGRPGHENQSLGLIKSLGIKNYTLQRLEFKTYGRFLSFLGPKFVFKHVPTSPYPDVIIGTGQHISGVSAYIKRRSPTTFLIHLMNIPKNPQLFNVIAPPTHSGMRYSGENVIYTLGAVNAVTDKKIKQEYQRWEKRFSILNQPITSVLIGGNSKRFNFDVNLAQKLAEDLVNFAKKNKTSLLISNSRRTGVNQTKKIIEVLDRSKLQYIFNDVNNLTQRDNPYLALLGAAENIVVTADSVSMVSESASTRKNVLVWGREFMKLGKFKYFYNELLKHKFVIDFSKMDSENAYSHVQLKEGQRVSGFVRSKYMQWHLLNND